MVVVIGISVVEFCGIMTFSIGRKVKFVISDEYLIDGLEFHIILHIVGRFIATGISVVFFMVLKSDGKNIALNFEDKKSKNNF